MTVVVVVVSKAYATQSTQSPEVMSKAAPNDEDVNESVKTLKDKLSDALLNISVKDDLVKQHAKVAEEAVSGILFSYFFSWKLYYLLSFRAE